MFQDSGPFAEMAGSRFGFQPLEMEELSQDAWALDSRPSLLVVGNAATQADIGAMAQGAGFRVAGAVSIDDMAERLALTVGVDTLVLDLRGLHGDDQRLLRMLAILLGWPGWCDAR